MSAATRWRKSISQLFRLPPNGKPITVMQLAGFPAEVVDAVVSVLCRMAFDFGLWSDGASPMLFVCEEAHRYASADRTVGFGPTRRAISRIAKEGRKYGVYLGLVTQRPAELDPTIISQCSTLFAMRLSNDRDQALLRSAVSDTAANLFAFVPSLGTREALAFGVGVPLPTRLTFSTLPQRSAAAQRSLCTPIRSASGRCQFARLYCGRGRALARFDAEPATIGDEGRPRLTARAPPCHRRRRRCNRRRRRPPPDMFSRRVFLGRRPRLRRAGSRRLADAKSGAPAPESNRFSLLKKPLPASPIPSARCGRAVRVHPAAPQCGRFLNRANSKATTSPLLRTRRCRASATRGKSIRRPGGRILY